MVESNVHNVFKGEDSMKKFFDPDFQYPLPLVELPRTLNPLRDDGVRIYAKMMTALPCQNVKALPALNMLQQAGPSACKTILEPSSGSTVTSLSMVSRVLHGNQDVHAYVSNKTERSRLRTLQFFGLKVVLYGGPAQPEISDDRGQIHKLHQLAQERQDVYNPGQYENLANPAAHDRWTGPQLFTQVPEINIFCTGMGSAGCVTGIGRFLKKNKPSVTVIGVCNSLGDSIPGPRPLSLLDKILFPWKQVTDAVREVNSVHSYRLSMALSREGIICGPSSGMALKGLYEFLQEQKDCNRLQAYADPVTKEISCVFLCCDLPYQYMDNYFEKLGDDDFLPIENPQLADIDRGTYDSAWEISYLDMVKIKQEKSPVVCSSCKPFELASNMDTAMTLDLRQPADFAASCIGGSLNLSLKSLDMDTPSPFDHVSVLEAQAKEIENILTDLSIATPLRRSNAVFLICYTGETARLTCSAMRRIGIAAYSLKGGFRSLKSRCPCNASMASL